MESNAQRVKYKDLFQLLDAKKYDQAEPFLKTFLRNPKNASHANAHLQMAKIYQERSGISDPVRQADRAISYADSAVIHYTKARNSLNEKEVKKNEEYYQAYLRRDLRTGKIGIKVSDITFDLEKKIEALENRKVRISRAKSLLTKADSVYSRANTAFVELQKAFADINSLYLQANDSLLKVLTFLGQQHETAMNHLEDFRQTARGLSSAEDQIVFKEVNIQDFGSEGSEKSSFYHDHVRIWKYDHWSERVKKTIEEEIIPTKMLLLQYHRQIGDLENKTKYDSTLYHDEIWELEEALKELAILKYDSFSLPFYLLGYRLAEIAYWGTYLQNEKMRDSLDVLLQVEMARKDLEAVRVAEGFISVLRDLEMEAAKPYPQLIEEAHSGGAGLTSFIERKEMFVKAAMVRHREDFTNRDLESRWMIHKNDSIPLFSLDALPVGPGEVYYPIVIREESYTAGVVISGSHPVKGYFSFIDRSRRPGSVVYFEITDSLKLEDIQMVSAFEHDSLQYYLLAYFPVHEQDNWMGNLMKASNAEGLIWNKTIDLGRKPESLLVSSKGTQVVITYKSSEIEIGDSNTLTIDIGDDMQN